MSAHDRYSVIAKGVIYGVLANLCRNTKHQLCVVSTRTTPLFPCIDKKCGNVNEHNSLPRTLDLPGENELLPHDKASWSSL